MDGYGLPITCSGAGWILIGCWSGAGRVPKSGPTSGRPRPCEPISMFTVLLHGNSTQVRIRPMKHSPADGRLLTASALNGWNSFADTG